MPRGGASDVLLRIRAYAGGRVAPGTLTRARDVARGILDSAGLATDWRIVRHARGVSAAGASRCRGDGDPLVTCTARRGRRLRPGGARRE